jgi:hypothetical protein
MAHPPRVPTRADAPVRAVAEIDVPAAQLLVWGILIAVDDWPTWNDDIRWVRTEGPIGPAVAFAWKSGPGTIRTTVETFESPRHLALTGGTLGIRADHDWRLEALPDGGTHVRTEETWSGPIASLLRGRLQRRLERRLGERLEHLRAEAGRRAAAGAGGGGAGA